MADDRRARRRDADRGIAAELVLELGVVAQGAVHEIVLDQRIGELDLASGVAEVHPRARAGDRIAADDPVPGRALGADAYKLLILVEVLEAQPLDQDVVN